MDLTSTHNLCLRAKIRKKKMIEGTPVQPSFTCIKEPGVGGGSPLHGRDSMMILSDFPLPRVVLLI